MPTDEELEMLDDRPTPPPITDERKHAMLAQLIAMRDELWRALRPAEAAAFDRHLAEAQARYLRDSAPAYPLVGALTSLNVS